MDQSDRKNKNFNDGNSLAGCDAKPSHRISIEQLRQNRQFCQKNDIRSALEQNRHFVRIPILMRMILRSRQAHLRSAAFAKPQRLSARFD
jgi:hypothetical protein